MAHSALGLRAAATPPNSYSGARITANSYLIHSPTIHLSNYLFNHQLYNSGVVVFSVDADDGLSFGRR